MTAKKDGALQLAIGKIGEMVDNSVKVDLGDEDVEMKNEIKVLEYHDEDENAMVDTEPTSPQNKIKDVVEMESCSVEKQSSQVEKGSTDVKMPQVGKPPETEALKKEVAQLP